MGLLILVCSAHSVLGINTHFYHGYSGLENSMDRGAWWTTVHRAAKSRTPLTLSHFHHGLF